MFQDVRLVPTMNDARVHQWDDGCWCGPFTTEVPDEVPALTLVVHRSFPGGPVLEYLPGVLVSHAQRAEDGPPW